MNEQETRSTPTGRTGAMTGADLVVGEDTVRVEGWRRRQPTNPPTCFLTNLLPARARADVAGRASLARSLDRPATSTCTSIARATPPDDTSIARWKLRAHIFDTKPTCHYHVRTLPL